MQVKSPTAQAIAHIERQHETYLAAHRTNSREPIGYEWTVPVQPRRPSTKAR